MGRRDNNNVSKSLRDYMAPIVIIGVVGAIVLNYIFSGETKETTTNGVNTTLSVEIKDGSTGILTLANGSKKELSSGEEIVLSKSEKIGVSEGNILLKDNTGNTFNLSKLGEFRYNDSGNSSYTLYSADLWVNAINAINVDMRYANISAKANSVFNLSQNEVASSVYVVSGTVELKTLAGKQVVLTKGEKIIIMRTNTNDTTYDTETAKEKIDDYIKTDSWFLLNGGEKELSLNDNNTSLLSSGTLSGTGLENTLSGTESILSSNETISFDNLYDEMIVKNSDLEITGKLQNENIYKIDINGNIASLDNTEKTFKVSLKLTKKVEDIIYKVYDDSLRVLQKGVITVYYDGGEENTISSSSSNTTNLADVKNYSISKSPLYTVTPKQNPYNTTENVVRMEGNVPPKTVSKIFINDFQLKKFPAYGSYWYYFANTDFGNLKPGINMYEIKYFDGEDKLLYTNTFIIVKEEPVNNSGSQNNVNSESITNSGVIETQKEEETINEQSQTGVTE